jgi:hypothetical protein
MSFSIAPKAGPTQEVQSTGHKTPEQQSARERAIQKVKEARGMITVTERDTKAPIEIEAPMNLEQKSEEKHPLEAASTQSSSESLVQGEVDESVKSEAAPSAESKAPADDKDPLSTHYAAMARKEKALRAKVQQQELQFKQREEALKAREEALSSKDSEYKSSYVSKDDLKRDPWSVLQDLGVTYDQITEMALTSQSVPPVVMQQMSKLERMLEEERSERKRYEENFKKQQEEQQTAAYKQAVETLKRDASALVKDNPSYELIAATDSSADVVELIETTFKEEGRVMSVQEAADEIEKYLEEEAYKLSQLKKIQSKIKPALKETSSPDGKVEVKFQAKQQQKTLTNALGATKPLSARDRAILAAQGKLNK